MSKYAPWKALERRHAKRMGGKRLWRPDYSESIPDGETEKDIWDCKALSRQRVVTMFAACWTKYRTYAAGRRFHLCLFDPTRPGIGDLVVIPAWRFEELLAKEELADGTLSALTEFDPPPPEC